jgi:hypothetical protein
MRASRISKTSFDCGKIQLSCPGAEIPRNLFSQAYISGNIFYSTGAQRAIPGL